MMMASMPRIGGFSRGNEKIAEVIIVAPMSEMSAVGHAITLSNPLRVKKIFKIINSLAMLLTAHQQIA